MSQILCNLQVYIIYQYKGLFYSVSAHVCCIKVHAEMAGTSQVKIEVLIFTGAPVFIIVLCFFVFFFHKYGLFIS